MTRVRLPTTPVPSATPPLAALTAPVPELVGLLVARDEAAGIGGRIRALLPRCDAVLVVDDGSTDGTADAAREAGARVLRLPAPRGEGAALKGGMRLARELGYIGALSPGEGDLSLADLDLLAHAHVRAPEALILGVGPGQALAGKEWEAAWAEARGEEPPPYPDWRPPALHGLPRATIGLFERLVETRYAYPWGGPRVLPLQSVLRRTLKEDGAGVHLELLARGVAAGIPTVELELSAPPPRPVVSCRKVNLRLLANLAPLVVGKAVQERLGMGGGYAPPTTSPLLLLLSAALVVALSGCPPKAVEPAVAVDCAVAHPVATWPGAGDADAALAELLAARAPVSSYLAEQGVEVSDPGLDQNRSLRGVLARDGATRLRLRLMSMGFTVLDYVENAGEWHLTVPPAGIALGGVAGEPFEPPAGMEAPGPSAVRPELIASLLRSVQPGASVRWQVGTCAVLEELDGTAPVRRLAFEPFEGGWRLAREELLEEGDVALSAEFTDWRDLGDGALWAHVWDLRDPRRGSLVHLETKRIRFDGLTDQHFAVPDFGS
jgi:hypothetical protein